MPTATVIRPKLDTRKIDERIAKLQRLRELLEDPECRELIADMFLDHDGGDGEMNAGDTSEWTKRKGTAL